MHSRGPFGADSVVLIHMHGVSQGTRSPPRSSSSLWETSVRSSPDNAGVRNHQTCRSVCDSPATMGWRQRRTSGTDVICPGQERDDRATLLGVALAVALRL